MATGFTPQRNASRGAVSAWGAVSLLLAAFILVCAYAVFRSVPRDGDSALLAGQRAEISLQDGSVHGNPRLLYPQDEVPPETPVEEEPIPASEEAPAGPAPAAPTEAPPAAASQEVAPPAEIAAAPSANPPTTSTEPPAAPVATPDKSAASAPAGSGSWATYARPAPKVAGPVVAVLISGLGPSRAVAEAAMTLPADVGLAFSPYAADVSSLAAAARAESRELYVELPLEPADYPQVDAGPYALLVRNSAQENMARLTWVLTRFGGYAGVLIPSGEKFSDYRAAVRPVLLALKARNLLVVYGKPGGESPLPELLRATATPGLRADAVLEAADAAATAEDALATLEATAKARGTALVIAGPYPATLRSIAGWIDTLPGKGITLVPVSAVARSKNPPAPPPQPAQP